MQSYEGHCWPNEKQRLLLHAALDEGVVALSAWEKWVSQVDIEKVDPFSYQMMPKIYKNISREVAVFSHVGLLKGIYKRTWMYNQLLLDCMTKTLRQWPLLEPKNLLFMKGAAMCAAYYEDFGVRVMGDLDILVPTSHIVSLMRHLLNHQFQACDALSIQASLESTWCSPRHAVSFKSLHTPESFLLDVHTTPLVEMSTLLQKQPTWFSDAVPMVYHGETWYRLSATDLLLQTCIHGAQYSRVPLLRWIMDATTLLRKAPHDIDWDSLLWQCQTYHLVLPMKQALHYLHTMFSVDVPSKVLSAAQTLPVTAFDQRDFYLKNRKVGRFFHIVLNLWSQAKRQDTSFLNYLKAFWGLASIFQIPIMACKKTSVFLLRERKKR